jgi:hypothetical protein
MLGDGIVRLMISNAIKCHGYFLRCDGKNGNL